MLILAALAATAQPLDAATSWFSQDWQYRREISVARYVASGLDGADIGVVTFPTAGLTKPDGSDIRIVTPSGNEVPSRVLMIGPGDKATVAFAMPVQSTKYYAYFGNAKAAAPKMPEIKRGVLLEMWSYDGGPVRTLAEVRQALAVSKVFIGRQFRDRVFIGFNPFGSQERIAASYTGWLNVAKAGKHVFASSSRDASFLLIDDKVVVDNGGIHQPQQDVSKHGEVELAAGLHKLTFYHVVTRGAPVAVAAWQPPGETKIAPIPAKAFAPVLTMESAPLEQYGREGIIDFLPRFAGECSHGGGYSERFVFEALPAKSGYTYEWDFGDGQKSVQAKASHVYLAGGEYKVTLTAKTPYGPQTRTNVLAVDRPWEQLADIKPEPLKTHQDVVATYDFAALSAEACARALIVLDGLDQTDTVVRAGKALTARPQAPAELLGEAMRVYCAALRKARDPGAAVSACVAASKMTANPAVSAEMLVGGGKVALSMGSKEDLRVAEDLFQQTIRKYETMTTAPPIRQAKIGLGDVWRARGDYDKAREAYVGARLGPEAQSGKYAIIRGDFARHVEDYVRKAELWSAQEYLDRWENTFPLDKLEGYWSLLTVRVDMAHKRWHEAITEAQTLVGVNPTSNYAAELLLLVADCHQELRQYDKAAAALRQVADNYRESPLAAEASQRLAKMPASAPTKAAPAAGKPSTQP